MNKLIFILSLLMLPVAAMAASDQDPDIKQWNEGAITWADFKGIAPTDTNAPISSFQCTLDVKKINLGKGREYFAYAYMDKLHSYVTDTTLVTPNRLQYHQLQFNMLEVMRRRLQNEIGMGLDDQQVQERLAYYRTMYLEGITEIDNETEYGANATKVNEWGYFTQKNLEQMAVPEFPQAVPSNWGYGAIVGLGAIFPTGDITNTFNANVTFNAGLVGIYRNFQLQATVAYGQPGLANRNVFNIFDEAGRPLVDAIDNNASFLNFTVSLGYSVIKNNNVSVTPHAGIYWGKYQWTATNLEWEQNEETGEYESRTTSTETQRFKDLSWMAGIDFDIRLHTARNEKRNSNSIKYGRGEQFTSSLRITPYVAHAMYRAENPAVKGYYVGVTVSYFGLARTLRLR